MSFEEKKLFDEQKSKVLKYILYKKRTENEVRKKFENVIDEYMLDDIIEYLKRQNILMINNILKEQ